MNDLAIFVGRLHPLVVHLPIGILLLAAVLEFWPGGIAVRTRRLTWGLGAASALAAVGIGWVLAETGGYGDEVFAHRWLGVGVAVLAVVGFALSARGGLAAKLAAVTTAVVLGLAGHAGGNLTHGEDYLWAYAPGVVQAVAGYEPSPARAEVDLSGRTPDSVAVFAEVLQPLLELRCIECHDASRQNGGLRLDAPHHVLAGGRGGPIVVAGKPMASEWVRRVTLPRSNRKSMPPKGDAIDYADVRLLSWWIERGADTLARIVPEEVPEDVAAILQRRYGLAMTPKPFVERLTGPAASEDDLAALAAEGWLVERLSPSSPALSVKVVPGGALAPGAWRVLSERVPEQVAWLDVGGHRLAAEEVELLAGLPNLYRLRLDGTDVTDASVERLASLPHLASLNLYDTPVTDAALEALVEAPALRQLYLFQSGTTAAGVEAFAEARPDVEVDRGFSFAIRGG